MLIISFTYVCVCVYIVRYLAEIQIKNEKKCFNNISHCNFI